VCRVALNIVATTRLHSGLSRGEFKVKRKADEILWILSKTQRYEQIEGHEPSIKERMVDWGAFVPQASRGPENGMNSLKDLFFHAGDFGLREGLIEDGREGLIGDHEDTTCLRIDQGNTDGQVVLLTVGTNLQ
jgi:hypothetical protein